MLTKTTYFGLPLGCRAILIFCVFHLLSTPTKAQDLDYVRQVIDTLCSPTMFGRSALHGGERLAADFIQAEFQRLGVSAFEQGYQQAFSLSLNTFPKNPKLRINGKPLSAGHDYILSPLSRSGKGSGRLVFIDSLLVNDAAARQALLSKHKRKLQKRIVVYEQKDFMALTALEDGFWGEIQQAQALLTLFSPKLTASMGTQQLSNPTFWLLPEALPSKAKRVNYRLTSDLLTDYQSQNVIGYVPGTSNPTQYLVLTAHYDHLGGYGTDTYFPGANDNASGVALLLSLAQYYAQNPAPYSVVFIAFGAEEVGLIGSAYYTRRPYFPLEQILFLLNLDLVGTGDDGLMAVNGAVFKEEFERLQNLNTTHQLLPNVQARGSARNSDHYYFYEQGVPCFFLYTLGGIKAYHDVYDVPSTLPLTKFAALHQLIRLFLAQY
ncbi:M28 family metallopeptidase [Eisenibacter elegans]|uniref:M28 family metallopeptidase n=1 Tax=Eisenibacter elegans TaxID=997 RepID=UPI000418B601|nr:M28 family peptidase [Eisenibacter elegans]